MNREFEKYRAEFWAVNEARKLDLPVENVLIKPVGAFERGTKDDIEAVFELADAQGIEDYLTLNVRRDSVLSSGSDAEIYSILQEVGLNEGDVEKNRDEISLPLDLEFNHFRVLLEEFEQQGGIDGSVFLYGTAGVDGDDNLERVKRMIVSMIPRLHKIAGSLVEMEKVFSKALGEKVKLFAKRLFPLHSISTNRANERPALGSVRLGLDFVCGSFPGESKPLVMIEVFIESKRVLEFLPGGWGMKAVALLCDYLLPLEYEYCLELNHPAENLVLSDAVDISYLGFSSYI